MLMKQQGYFYLRRYPYRYVHLSSWWKVIVFLSSSTLTPRLSPHLRPLFCFAPIVAQAAFHSSLKIDFGRIKNHYTTDPTLPAIETMSSNGSCIRRSSRLGSNGFDDTTLQHKGVRLFQTKSPDIENKNGSHKIPDENPSGASVTVSKKRRVTRSSSKTSDTSVAEMPKQKRSKRTKPVSTPVRGSSAVPVTPEPVEVESKSSPARSQRKATKTTEVKRKRNAKTNKPKPASKKKSSTTIVSWPEPDGWRETYELVRELRKDKTAPCDFMGAEALVAPPKDGDDDLDDEEYAKISRFQTLIALMLSSQTKDAMVDQAMKNLRDTSDGSGGLTVASILEMDPKVLNKKIYSVGFRNNKTKYIKQAAQILQDDYNGDIPPTAGEMIRDLPGVGPKMAYIVENICWDKQSGIGVDTHMQRLFPKLGWVSPKTKNPEQTRKQLESWLPQEYWGEVNLLWVGFGQEVQQERQKILRKALLSQHPLEALRLLRAVDFDVFSEWEKMQSIDTMNSDDDKREHVLWKNDSEMEEFNKMVEEAMSRKSKWHNVEHV